MQETITVTITVEGGVIQDIDLPPGVCAIVYDYDVDGVPDSETETDDNGDRRIVSRWGE